VPRNPWLDLPKTGQYVLPADRPHVEAFNDQQSSEYRLDLDMMPEPFAGNRRAKVVLLNRNPGRGADDPEEHKDNRRYIAALRANLEDPRPRKHVQVAVLAEFENTPAAGWGRRSFKHLIEHVGSAEALARRMLNVEFHGYHSAKWRPIGITLPSQRYGFWLVDRATARGATIVIMRGIRDGRSRFRPCEATHGASYFAIPGPR
jgi:hypothetical protein